MRFRCVIVIPCYNEAERLDWRSFAAFMERNPEIHFLFVNDGSRDDTGKILEKLCRATGADILDLPRNQGKAEAVRLGVMHVAGVAADYIGFWDADLATPLEELPRMLQLASPDTLYLSGCRLLRLGGAIERKPLRHYLSRIFATMISMRLDLPVYDTQCGAKLYAARDAEALFARPFVTRWFFDVEILERLIARHGRSAVLEQSMEVPLSAWRDVNGSKVKPLLVIADFCRLFCGGGSLRRVRKSR